MTEPSTLTSLPRRRGRPTANEAPLDIDRIVKAARTAMESGMGDFSMRGIAAALGVDPMALYHHVANKQALTDAVVEQAFASLDRLRSNLLRMDQPSERLFALAKAYLRCVTPIPKLTRHLARGPETIAHRRFQELFALALGKQVLAGSHDAAARDLLVDYLHGVALAGRKDAEKSLRTAWPLIMRIVNGVSA